MGTPFIPIHAEWSRKIGRDPFYFTAGFSAANFFGKYQSRKSGRDPMFLESIKTENSALTPGYLAAENAAAKFLVKPMGCLDDWAGPATK